MRSLKKKKKKLRLIVCDIEQLKLSRYKHTTNTVHSENREKIILYKHLVR